MRFATQEKRHTTARMNEFPVTRVGVVPAALLVEVGLPEEAPDAELEAGTEDTEVGEDPCRHCE